MDGTSGFRESFCPSAKAGLRNEGILEDNDQNQLHHRRRTCQVCVPEKVFNWAAGQLDWSGWSRLMFLQTKEWTAGQIRSQIQKMNVTWAIWRPKDGASCRSSRAQHTRLGACWATVKKFLNAKALFTPLLFHCLWKHHFSLFYSENQLRW